MPPTAPAILYMQASDLDFLLSADGTAGRLDDDNDGSLNSTEVSYLTAAIAWATEKVNFYLLASYDASDLATSYLVNNWCVVCAAKWLSCRRGNPPPEAVDDLYDEVIADMKLVKAGEYQIPSLGTRDVAWPAWSNVRVDCLYALRKIRVERPISEKSPTLGYTQNRDVLADAIVEPN